MNILFVCTANISRSFLAEKLMKYRMDQLQLKHISVSSAGVFAIPGSPPDSKMVEYLQDMNIPFDEHESKLLDETTVDWSDIILAMEKNHRDQIIAFWPHEKNKVHLLSQYLASDQYEDDVSDPYGSSTYFYRVAISHISLAVENIVQKILSSRPIA